MENSIYHAIQQARQHIVRDYPTFPTTGGMDLIEVSPDWADYLILHHPNPSIYSTNRADRAIFQRFSINRDRQVFKGLFGLNHERYKLYLQNAMNRIFIYIIDIRARKCIATGFLLGSIGQVSSQNFMRKFQELERLVSRGGIGWHGMTAVGDLIHLHTPILYPKLFIHMIDSLLVIPNQTRRQQQQV